MAEHPTGDRVRRDTIPEEARERSKALGRLEALRPAARKLALRLGLQQPLAHLDLESTGTDVSEDRIVEIAIFKLDPSGDVTLHSRKVNPGVPIPPDAVADSRDHQR